MITRSQPIGRRTFVAGAAAVAASAGRVRAQGLTRVRISGSPDADLIGTAYGVQAGIFQRLGLDVQITVMNSGPAASAALLGGSLDIGKSSMFSLITGHARGVPFVLEAAASFWDANRPTSALVVAKDSAIRSGRDLNGKTISVPALGDFYNVANMAWIDQNGGDSSTVKFIELPHRAAAESIAAGRVDAATLAPPILEDALQSGKVRILGRSLDAIGKQFLVTVYFCTADWAAKNGDTLTRFRKGLYTSATYANAHPAEMIPLISKISGVEEKVIATMPPEIVGTSQSQLNAKLIQPMIDAAVKYKVIAKGFPGQDMIDPALPTA